MSYLHYYCFKLKCSTYSFKYLGRHHDKLLTGLSSKCKRTTCMIAALSLIETPRESEKYDEKLVNYWFNLFTFESVLVLFIFYFFNGYFWVYTSKEKNVTLYIIDMLVNFNEKEKQTACVVLESWKFYFNIVSIQSYTNTVHVRGALHLVINTVYEYRQRQHFIVEYACNSLERKIKVLWNFVRKSCHQYGN